MCDVDTLERRIEMPNMYDEWSPVGTAHDLFSPPSATPRPLQYSAPLELNTEDLSPESFEKLVAQLAQKSDGARIAYIYGTRGQAQQGIDVIALFDDGEAKSYQVKRYQTFTISDIESVISKFAEGSRPLGSNNLVVAVACIIDRTEIIDRMHELSRLHQITVDIWDKRAISNRLRLLPDLVSAFFGNETARAFCPGAHDAEISPDSTDRLALADAVARGPYKHLQLDGAVEAAQQFLETQPLQAAALYKEVASRLLAEGYATHARPIRRARIDALKAADKIEDAAKLAIDLALEQVDTADGAHEISDTVSTLHNIDELQLAHCRSRDAIDALAATMSGHESQLDEFVAAFDTLEIDDRGVLTIAVHFAESAISARRLDIATDRLEFLTQVFQKGNETRESEALLLRLDMCLAEARGKWTELLRRCRQSYGRMANAWAHARKARIEQFRNNSEEAVADFESAISDAVVYGYNIEASDWLYALRYTRSNIPGSHTQRDDLHPLAMHLSSQQTAARLPGNPNFERLALESIVDGSPLASLGRLSRWRRNAYIRADLTGEVRATRELGKLLAANLEVFDGIQHLIWTGSGKAAQESAQHLPEITIEWAPQSDLGTPRQMEALFEAATASSDLIADSNIESWLDLAWDYASLQGQVASTLFHRLDVEAVRLIAALRSQITQEYAAKLIDLLSSSVPHDTNKYRFTDKDHALLLASIAKRFPELREAALSDLLKGLPFSQYFASHALGSVGAPLLREDPDFAERAFLALEPKTHNVLLGLALIDRPNDAVTEHAKSLQKRLIERPSSSAEVQTIWSGNNDLFLFSKYLDADEIRAIVEKLTAIAFDNEEAYQNRHTAMEEIGLFASKLPADVQEEVFQTLVPVTQAFADARSEDTFLDGTDHPLSFMRVNLLSRTLADAAIASCSYLELSEQQRRDLASSAVALLRHAEDVDILMLARSLVTLLKGRIDFPLEFLAAHPNPTVQACGAYLWANTPANLSNPSLGEMFAKSPSKIVRATLAQNITTAEHPEITEILRSDPRRAIREELATREIIQKDDA
jgi:hypothetical protein